LLIAFVVLPIFVPLAVLLNEPLRLVRRAMMPLAHIGCGSCERLVCPRWFAGPCHRANCGRITSHEQHCAQPRRVHRCPLCGRHLLERCFCQVVAAVVVFGIANLAAVAVIAWLTIDGFASVWCGWAAVSMVPCAPHACWWLADERRHSSPVSMFTSQRCVRSVSHEFRIRSIDGSGSNGLSSNLRSECRSMSSRVGRTR